VDPGHVRQGLAAHPRRQVHRHGPGPARLSPSHSQQWTLGRLDWRRRPLSPLREDPPPGARRGYREPQPKVLEGHQNRPLVEDFPVKRELLRDRAPRQETQVEAPGSEVV